MPLDFQELEANLKGLHPAALDSELLARLEESIHGRLPFLSADEAGFEALLRQTRPTALSPALTATLEAACYDTAGTMERSIIPFQQSLAAPASRIRRGNHPMLAAAAAVALLGAAAALFMPGKGPLQAVGKSDTQPPQSSPFSKIPSTPTPTSPSSQNYVPATFNTGLSQAKDEGVLWQSTDQPRRVVKVVYRDRVTLVNSEGKEIVCEQPRVEYLLIPEKID